MTWLNIIIQSIDALGGVADYDAIYDFIEKNSTRPLSIHWKASVRAIIEDHSSDAQFRSGNDIFYSASGIGKGVWGLRSKIESTPIALDVSEPALPPKVKLEVSRIIRDTFLSRQLKQLNNFCCQICGKTIVIKNKKYAEAHHIQPLGLPHNGPDISQNIVIVCPNHHVEFDYGVIGIDPLTLRTIHLDKSNEFHNISINCKNAHILGPVYLQYHLEKIFNH
jgi:hypothetical protein